MHKLDVPQFDALADAHTASKAVSLGIFDRIPFVFETVEQYVTWRDSVALGFGLDGKDLIFVGSAATGRSLSTRKGYGVFNSKSDLDIAAVSSHHFDLAWRWFRSTNPNFLTGMDDDKRKKFNSHKSHYIFDGVIASDYFLSYLPFGDDWGKAMHQSQALLPRQVQGRLMKFRIYKDFAALRASQTEAMALYQKYRANKLSNRE